MNAEAIQNGHDQRAEATRQAIIDAAVSLYHQRGAEQVTVSSIINASGVGRTTFYRHFQDQDEVLNQALARDFQQMLSNFEAQRFEHATVEAQIIDDTVWFVRQLSLQPALSLLYGEQRTHYLARINATLKDFRGATLRCVGPTYARAEREGRLRDGVTLERYVDWVTFVVTSLETVDSPFGADEIALREMLQRFLVPSVLRDR